MPLVLLLSELMVQYSVMKRRRDVVSVHEAIAVAHTSVDRNLEGLNCIYQLRDLHRNQRGQTFVRCGLSPSGQRDLELHSSDSQPQS